jgi:protein-tyrosine phosphatase
MYRSLRRLSVTGAYNVRDLGGYGTLKGGTVCYGKFLRGDSLHNLTDVDVRLLVDYGVRTVIDLREPGESGQEPGRLNGDSGVVVHHVPLLAALAPALGGVLPSNLGETYVLCARHCTGALRTIFELLAGAADGGVLFHCVVGKDRTGIVAALLLELAGVSREAILADYAASGVFLQPLVERLVRQYEQDPATGVHPDFLVCEPGNMARLLDTLQSEHGGADSYLRNIGVSEGTLERLKRRILCEQVVARPSRELVGSPFS